MSKRPLEELTIESSEKSKPQEKPTEKREPSFKNPNFVHANVVGNRKKPWRTLKQILAAEAALDWPQVGGVLVTLHSEKSWP